MTTHSVAMLGALPIAGQALQVVGALLTTRYGHRRTAVFAMAISRQAFLPLAFLPALPLGAEDRRVLLLVVAGVHHGLGVVASNAWNDFIGETVPRRLWGRFFGRRTAVSTLAGGLTALAGGIALDRGHRLSAAGPVLQVLALLASGAGAVSLVLVMRQQAWPPRCRRSIRERALTSFVRPFLDPEARLVIGYTFAWHAACGLSAPFFGLYLLQDLRTGYALLAAQGAGFALARVASASAWGRAVDGVGASPVLAVCTAGLALSPLSWIACDTGRLWPLALEAAIGGVLFGGHTVASFAMQLSVAPSRQRPYYLGAIAAAGGLAFAITCAAGGALADVAHGTHVSLRTLLAGSAALRVAAVVAALVLSLQRKGIGRI